MGRGTRTALAHASLSTPHHSHQLHQARRSASASRAAMRAASPALAHAERSTLHHIHEAHHSASASHAAMNAKPP